MYLLQLVIVVHVNVYGFHLFHSNWWSVVEEVHEETQEDVPKDEAVNEVETKNGSNVLFFKVMGGDFTMAYYKVM